MRLVNVHTYEFKEVYDESCIKYAILSHRWGDEEILFEDMPLSDELKARKRESWYKFEGTCKQAIRDDLDYVWIDTCCIDKKSSAELSEAINSMFRWYAGSEVCYAFLNDIVSEASAKKQRRELEAPQLGCAMDEPSPESSAHITDGETISKSAWFERGWTLQELLAPRNVVFYDRCWDELGNRHRHSAAIRKKTRIQKRYLSQSFASAAANNKPCTAEIMTWVRGRKTSRGEDRSYSLMGLFGVNMPLLYGEGARNAFLRLQEEILRKSSDQSILAWTGVDETNIGPLAPSPDYFPLDSMPLYDSRSVERRHPHQRTNEGISAEFYLEPIHPRVYYAWLNFLGGRSDWKRSKCYAILLRQVDETCTRFARIATQGVLPDLYAQGPRQLGRFGRGPLRLITIVSELTLADGKDFARDIYEDVIRAEIRWLKGSAVAIDNAYSATANHVREPKASWSVADGIVWQWTNSFETLDQSRSGRRRVGLVADLAKVSGVLPIERIQIGFDHFYKPILFLSLTKENNFEKLYDSEGKDVWAWSQASRFAEVDHVIMKVPGFWGATLKEWRNGCALTATPQTTWELSSMGMATILPCTDGSFRLLICELRAKESDLRCRIDGDPVLDSPWVFSMKLSE